MVVICVWLWLVTLLVVVILLTLRAWTREDDAVSQQRLEAWERRFTSKAWERKVNLSDGEVNAFTERWQQREEKP